MIYASLVRKEDVRGRTLKKLSFNDPALQFPAERIIPW